MLMRRSLFAVAVATFALAAGPSYAAPPDGGDITKKPKTGQAYTKPVSNNTTPSGAVSNSGGIVSKTVKSGGNNSGTGQSQGKGGCGHPGQPACKIGGVEHCKSGVVSHGYCAPYPKVIVINKYPHHVYQNRYVPVPAGVAGPVVSAPAAPATCLTKEYLQADLVMFKDTCAKQWAMNTTTVAKPVTAATARTCLTKEDLANDTVLFKDICSGEWAKNPKD